MPDDRYNVLIVWNPGVETLENQLNINKFSFMNSFKSIKLNKMEGTSTFSTNLDLESVQKFLKDHTKTGLCGIVRNGVTTTKDRLLGSIESKVQDQAIISKPVSPATRGVSDTDASDIL